MCMCALECASHLGPTQPAWKRGSFAAARGWALRPAIPRTHSTSTTAHAHLLLLTLVLSTLVLTRLHTCPHALCVKLASKLGDGLLHELLATPWQHEQRAGLTRDRIALVASVHAGDARDGHLPARVRVGRKREHVMRLLWGVSLASQTC